MHITKRKANVAFYMATASTKSTSAYLIQFGISISP
jgi:hypothetical protein